MIVRRSPLTAVRIQPELPAASLLDVLVRRLPALAIEQAGIPRVSLHLHPLVVTDQRCCTPSEPE